MSHPTSPIRPALALSLALSITAAAQAEPPALPQDLSGYVHIHSLVISDAGDPLFGFHHFYANTRALSALSEGGPYPEGAVFLAAVYEPAKDGAQINEGAPAAWTMMTKDPAAKKTGGWRFAKFTPDGSAIEINETIACFTCHTQVKERDYVFSQPLEMALPRP